MDIVENPTGIDDWNPATDEGQQPPVPTALNAANLDTPVINLVQAKSNNGSVYVRVVIIDPENGSLIPVVRYRVADIGAGTPGAWVEQPFPDAEPSGGYINLDTNTVPVDQLLNVEVAFKSSNGKYSDWSITADVASTVDPVAPLALSSFALSGASLQLGRASFSFATANDTRPKSIALYRVPTGVALNKSRHTKITIGAAPGTSFSYVDGDATRVNLASNPGFDTDTVWTKGPNWTISGGKGNKAISAASSYLTQVFSLTVGKTYRSAFTVSARTAGNFATALITGSNVIGSPQTANGTHLFSLVAVTGNNGAGVRASNDAVGSVDDFYFFEETTACAPQGVWDYYAIPLNGSGIEGPQSGPVTITLVFE